MNGREKNELVRIAFELGDVISSTSCLAWCHLSLFMLMACTRQTGWTHKQVQTRWTMETSNKYKRKWQAFFSSSVALSPNWQSTRKATFMCSFLAGLTALYCKKTNKRKKEAHTHTHKRRTESRVTNSRIQTSSKEMRARHASTANNHLVANT